MKKLIATALLAGAFGFAVGIGVDYKLDGNAREDHGFARGLATAMVMARDHRLATDANSINGLILEAGLRSNEIYERPEKLVSMGIVTMDMVTNK